MAKRPVSTWPTYLLKSVPESERQWLSRTAAARNISVADVVRGLLCGRFRLRCPPESYRYEADKDTGAETILLRLQPKLAEALERAAARTGHSKRRIILETITSLYEKENTQ